MVKRRNSLATGGLNKMEPLKVNSQVETFTPSIASEPPMALTDEEVMLRLKAGEEDGFEVLLVKYRRPVIHFLYRMVHEQAWAEELAQDVFLRVYRARGSYKPTAKFTTWMFRIATNVGLNAIRDTRRRREKELSSDEEIAGAKAARVASRNPTPEQQVLASERAAEIRCAVDELPEKQRMAVLLHKYQALDYSEIAGILGVSQSALKSLLFRAYETLRVTLRPLAGGKEGKKGAEQ